MYQMVRIEQLKNSISLILLLILCASCLCANEYEGYIIEFNTYRQPEIVSELYFNYYFLPKDTNELIDYLETTNIINNNLLKNGSFFTNLNNSISSVSCCLIGYDLATYYHLEEADQLLKEIENTQDKLVERILRMKPTLCIDEYDIKILKVKLDICICNALNIDKRLELKIVIKNIFSINDISENESSKFKEYFESILARKK